MKSPFVLCLALLFVASAEVQFSLAAAVVKIQLKVVKADSEETNGQDGRAENAVDGNPNTYWHTEWNGKSPGLPHEITIELIPPCVISGFAYLPRQDASDHGVIKDYEFYLSDDGKKFNQPVKKGKFQPGKEEKIETFQPKKCRFIKLKAISEINGLSWTSAAEIRVLQPGEPARAKDYWRGNVAATNDPASELRNVTDPDPIDAFLGALAANHGLWLNGTDSRVALKARNTKQAVVETLRSAKFEAGLLERYETLETRKVRIGDFPGNYVAVLVDTNLGQMIVLLQYNRGHWWRRIYDASPQIKRLY
jgi:hypothetical protein